MHPDCARSLYDQRRQELTGQMLGRRARQARGTRRGHASRRAAGLRGFMDPGDGA